MDALFAYFLLRKRKYVPPRHERVQYNIKDLWLNTGWETNNKYQVKNNPSAKVGE